MPDHVLRPSPAQDSCPECGHNQFVAELSVTYTAKPNTTENTFDLYRAEEFIGEYPEAFQALYCEECHHFIIQGGEVVDPDALD